MEAIKKYSHVQHADEQVSFRISRMEDIYDSRSGKPDQPHRHDYYTVLLVRNADGQHIIDFNAYALGTHQLFFISPGQVHQVIERKRSVGYAVLFSPEFLVENNIPVGFLEDINLFNTYSDTPPMQLREEEMNQLSEISEEMIRLSASTIKFRNLAIGACLKLFLIKSNNLCTLDLDHPQRQEAGNTILRNFKKLVEQHYTEFHSTSEYAEMLNVTPDHLNRVIRSLLGKSAKEYIQERIILAAKRMLCFTDHAAKQIAYALGFSEPGNFSAFFKKETGYAPTTFRESVR
ncbi:MAG: helix-turn-helix transcriptional regulator [Bacteroidales bacterium]|nr:helix-turn-helix transcriptional regulator [Bacteroidales bacterium]MDT8431127.1 helix-turn-helix transcriptional regulator [Bacteroidales bacterium]